MVHLQTIQSLDRESQKAHASLAGFKTCLDFLRELSETYWHAGFYLDFFELAGAKLPTATSSNFRKEFNDEDLRSRRDQDENPTTKFLRVDDDQDHNQGGPRSLDSTTRVGSVPPSAQPESNSSNLGSEGPAFKQRYPEEIVGHKESSSDLENFMEFDENLLETWLDKFGLFQSLFPSL